MPAGAARWGVARGVAKLAAVAQLEQLTTG